MVSADLKRRSFVLPPTGDMREALVPAALIIFLTFSVSFALELETHMVSMRDGVLLATDVYLPSGEGPWPTILVRTPYGRGGAGLFDDWGYAVVTQDMRGFGDSEGVKRPFESDGWGDLQDGYDIIEWIANQSWSDGKVGTFGGSALGITQNLMAGSYPPHLICQHIQVAASDLYSQAAFPGGVFRESMAEGWLGENAAPGVIDEWKSHSSYSPSWDAYNSELRVPGMTYAGFHLGGWYDIFSQGTINAFVERQHNGGQGSAGNQKLVMGPWIHVGFFIRRQGELMYPPNSLYILRYFSDAKVFFDYWLKGLDNGLMDGPAVTYYVMGDVDDHDAPGNEWREADDWPIPCTNFSLYLSEENLTREPGMDSTDDYLYDSENPVPTVGGANLYLASGSMDQRSVEGREDVLVYTTEPLGVPVEITGRIYVQLFASSSCTDTDFMAKLTDVYPDGRSMLVLDGAIRARHRNSMEDEELMVPGEVYEFWIDLWSTSIVFNKGHRIRLAITSSNYPRFDANPNTGHPFGWGNETMTAQNTIYKGMSSPSRIILPLTGPDSDGDGIYDIMDPDPHVPVVECIGLLLPLLVLAATAESGFIMRRD